MVEIALLDSGGKVVSLSVQPAQGTTSPNVPVAVGAYQVRARLLSGTAELQSATVSIQLK